MLHIVSNSSLFKRCLEYAHEEDMIVLMDSEALLLVNPRIPQDKNLINYNQFVELVIKHHQTLTWF